MKNEREGSENETQSEPKGDEPVSDLSSKKPNRNEEENVKGGSRSGKHFPEVKLTS